jgi:glycine cleavage system transcriptional repressor
VPRFSLSAVGADRTGIVAAVSKVLVDLGCNLEDSTMAILQGYFAILLVIAAESDIGAADIEQALAPVAERLDLVLTVRPLPDRGEVVPTSEVVPWTISVHGADRTGMAHGVTSALEAVGGNVVDLSTHLVGDPGAPLYVMTLRVTLPATPDPEEAARHVQEAARSLGVHCTAHPDDSDTL